MKILVVSAGFGRGGGARVLSELANQWILSGHGVDFLLPQTSAPPYFPTSANILWAQEDGSLTQTPSHRHDRPRMRDMTDLRTLCRALVPMRQAYDVVLANHNLTTWPVWFAGVSRHRRFYYIQAYEPEYYSVDGHWLRWLAARLSYHLPFTRIVNAPLYQEYKNIRAACWVPPGLDLDLFHAKSAPRNFRDGRDIVLGCIGRFEKTKGTAYALEAFEALARGDPRYRLRVAYGNLPRDWAHPRCEFVVPRNDVELADYYRSLDIMIAPGTVQHGAPHYPVLEAMACGVPVVTTGYLPADEGNSWVVANRSGPAIAAAVREIVADFGHGERVARALKAIQDFAWPVVAARMMAIFAAEVADA